MKRKILIVDDSRTIRQQVSYTLKKRGYQVIEAEDGVEGIAAVRNHTDISMILSDISMPNMCGLEMVEIIGKDTSVNHIPVVMLTSTNAKDAMIRAKKAGTKGWIPKPFDPRILVETAERIAEFYDQG